VRRTFRECANQVSRQRPAAGRAEKGGDMGDFLAAISDFILATNVPEQFREVNVKALFTNVYFLIPLLAVIGHIIYRKSVNSLILLCLFFGVWLFSGSSYMDNLIVNGVLQLDKVLPLAGAGVVVISVLVYLVFIRD
jgi:uncharacterized membrane protein YgdD (TMEM256/DUF423 family)